MGRFETPDQDNTQVKVGLAAGMFYGFAIAGVFLLLAWLASGG